MPWIRLLPVFAQLRLVFPRKVTFFVFVTAVRCLMVRKLSPGSLPTSRRESCSRSLRETLSGRTANVVAFQEPETKPRGRGRKPVYGALLKLASLFDDLLTTNRVMAYGQEPTEVRYWTRDLLWKGTGKLVPYVGAIFSNGERARLMCTDIDLLPEAIIDAHASGVGWNTIVLNFWRIGTDVSAMAETRFLKDIGTGVTPVSTDTRLMNS